jgi:RimJ/RimL family protein N-acetyltransferase
VILRPVEPDDVAVFFSQQRDHVANEMAAFASRDRAAHDEHWAKILADDAVIARTIVAGDDIVGNIGSWRADGKRLIGYWIGREFWGQGYATDAVANFLSEVRERPVWAHVAEHNLASLRVLAKCGFAVVGTEVHDDDPVTEVVLRLDA